MRRPPDDFAGVELQRHQAAPGVGVDAQLDAEGCGLRPRRTRCGWCDANIGNGDIDMPFVRRSAPLHAAELAALADLGLPKHGAFAVRVERMDVARLRPAINARRPAGSVTSMAEEPKSTSGPLAWGQLPLPPDAELQAIV